MEFTQEEIRQKYDEEASWYDFRVSMLERLTGIARLRKELLRKATGKVLEIAVGTGRNFPYYPRDCAITAIDPSAQMLELARKRAETLHLHPHLQVMDAQALTFPNHSFDTVVSSLSLCTIPEPVRAVREVARVCHPDGKALLLEHGRSSIQWLARFQDRFSDAWYRRHMGCRWNREPLEFVRQAGFEILSARRSFFGIIHAIEAKPSSNPS
ncbi:class I SAM-dependent methyltransferase [Candidatus Peregrinibacteria bacterium]|nr:class I SAM-dependent methyltransferase [Candidatus Peregrinibacteria bacterium]MBI3816711.1 class I SAM-dependent methyltransferase [Candidatus Peregrinibacteria bacterium]